MDLKRELAAAAERHNPSYSDIGEYQFGATDSALNDVVSVWGGLDEQSRGDIDRQLLAILDAPLAAPRDFIVVSTAAKLCGRLNVNGCAAAAHRRLAAGALPLDLARTPRSSVALAFYNLIVSQASSQAGSAALSAMMRGQAVPSALFALTLQGYFRRFPLSFASAVRSFVSDLGDRLAEADWEDIWKHAGGAIDLGVLAVSLKDLPIERFPSTVQPTGTDFSWVIHQLFGHKKSPLVLRRASDDTPRDRADYVIERVQNWRGMQKNVARAQLLAPARDAEEYVQFAPFRTTLEAALASRLTEDIQNDDMDENLTKVINCLAFSRKRAA